MTEIQDQSKPSSELFKPYFDTVFEAFGPDRIMFGSDWPVALMGGDHFQWLEILKSLTTHLSKAEQYAIFESSCRTFYSLKP